MSKKKGPSEFTGSHHRLHVNFSLSSDKHVPASNCGKCSEQTDATNYHIDSSVPTEDSNGELTEIRANAVIILHPRPQFSQSSLPYDCDVSPLLWYEFCTCTVWPQTPDRLFYRKLNSLTYRPA